MAHPPLSIPVARGEDDLAVLAGMANRHGLVAGATGTGKTVTLRVMAEGFSRLGVPVFMADVKGDLSGLARPGSPDPKLDARARRLGMAALEREAYPVVLWDVFGKAGHPVRVTASEMGPLLLARILELNDVQQGVLQLAFRVADDAGLLLLDMKDLRAIVQHVGERAAELRGEYGNVSAASVGAIQRALLALEVQGGDRLFGAARGTPRRRGGDHGRAGVDGAERGTRGRHPARPGDRPGRVRLALRGTQALMGAARAKRAPPSREEIRVGISSCLLGEEVRWDGGHKLDRAATGLARYVTFVPVCPEVELGMGVPREPIRLERRGGRVRLVAPESGTDHTERMRRFAEARVRELERLGLCGYVFKEGSPSCGAERVRVWPGRAKRSSPSPTLPTRWGEGLVGRGLFAAVLMARMPLLPVVQEGELHDSALRKRFLERVFAYHERKLSVRTPSRATARR